ncbi:MAG: Response regulator receiver [uncultured bacterium]|nr:MAG: Response regulator receiver [uncultured bacterium]
MKRKKVMVIDDDEAILEVCKILLENEYDIETSTKGAVLLNKKRDYPDLILLDILLAGEDGIEIAKSLKRNEKTKKIPIVIFSAHSQGEEDAKKAGVNLFLQKPFEIEDLLAIVKHNIQ